MAIDILSATRAKAADAANARAAPPIPTFDAGKMFSQMLEQSFSARDAARQQANLRAQAPAPVRDDRPVPAARPEEPAARPAAARPVVKERPATPKTRDDTDDDTTVDAKARPAEDDDKPVDGDKEVAAKADDQSAGQDAKPRQDQPDQAAAVQAATVMAAPVATQPKIEPKAEQDDGAADAAAALVARTAQAASAATTPATPQDKPADAMAATLQAMTPQQVSEVANLAAPAAKSAKVATEGPRTAFSQAEAALADLLADIGGGSIVSAPAGSGTGTGTGAGNGGQAGGGLLDGAAWSLMQQAPGVSTAGTTQAMSFAGLLQAGLSAKAEQGGLDDAAAMPAAASGVEATTATTGALPLAAGIMPGVDGPDMPHAAAQAQAGRPALPLPVADQVAAHLGKAIKDEVKAINVQLNPEELGRVDIRLEFGADGKVSAHVTADNPQALDLLQRDQRALERSLTDAGLKTDNSSLSFSLRGDGAGNDGFNRFAQNQGGNQGGQGQQRGGRGNAVADVGGIDAGPATARPRTIAADGALDIKV